jgi:hypothetical protein
MLVCFPTFVLTVNMSLDCHLSYEPLGCCDPIEILHYAQPLCPPTLYLLEIASSTPLSCRASPRLVVIKEESDALVVSVLGAPNPHPASGVQHALPTDTSNDLSTISTQLCSSPKAISNLLPPTKATPTTSPKADPPPCSPPFTTPTTKHTLKPPCLLSTQFVTPLSNSFIVGVLITHQVVHAILPTHWIPKHTGCQKNFITLWVVARFGIISTSSRLAAMANGKMVANCTFPWVPMQKFKKQQMVALLTGQSINTLTMCIWILLLGSAFWLEVSAMLLFWLIRSGVLIGRLD